MGQRYRTMKGQKPGPVCVAHNHDLAKGKDLQPTVIKFSQNISIGRRGELTSVNKNATQTGVWGWSPQPLEIIRILE